MIVTIIAFFVILSILVLIHELGHFISAKRFGIKVEEFGFGFPPRIFGKKIGETIYSINLLPVGGFVKLYGEDAAGGGSVKKIALENSTSDVKRAFFARPSWQRAIIVLAGVVMNFLLAVVLISYLFAGPGIAVPTKNIRVVDVSNNSPAQNSGISKGDEIISIYGRKVSTTSEFANIAKSKAGKAIEIEFLHNQKLQKATLTPRLNVPKGEGPIGVAITNTEHKKYPWYQAPFFGTFEALRYSFMILQGLVDLVANLVLHGQAPIGVAGPVGVAELTGKAVSYGFVATLWFVSLLSLNLAVVNVLPIPALDGGRLFFILIEMIFRKKISSKYESIAHAVGLAVLLGLILFITFFDVARVLSGKSLFPNL